MKNHRACFLTGAAVLSLAACSKSSTDPAASSPQLSSGRNVQPRASLPPSAPLLDERRGVAERVAAIEALPVAARVPEAVRQTQQLFDVSPGAAGQVLQKIYAKYLLRDAGRDEDGAPIFTLSPSEVMQANAVLLDLLGRHPVVAAEVIARTPRDLQPIQWEAVRQNGERLLREQPRELGRFLSELEDDQRIRLAWEITETTLSEAGADEAARLWRDVEHFAFNPARVIEAVRVNGRVPYEDERPSF